MEVFKKTIQPVANMLTLTISKMLTMTHKGWSIQKIFEHYNKKRVPADHDLYAFNIISDFTDTMLYEMIYNNAVIEIRKNYMYIFIAQRNIMSDKYESNKAVPHIYIKGKWARLLRLKPVMILHREWANKLEAELRAGHRYDNESIIKQNINAGLYR